MSIQFNECLLRDYFFFYYIAVYCGASQLLSRKQPYRGCNCFISVDANIIICLKQQNDFTFVDASITFARGQCNQILSLSLSGDPSHAAAIITNLLLLLLTTKFFSAKLPPRRSETERTKSLPYDAVQVPNE